MAQHRADRLKKALRIAIHVAGITDDQAALLIREMRDDKGTLCVAWRMEPSQHQRRALDVAWELCGETVVRHTF